MTARSLWLCFWLVSATSFSAAQNSGVDGYIPNAIMPGTPNSAYTLNDLFQISYSSGRMNLFLPLLKVGGRGEVTVPIGLRVNQTYTIDHSFTQSSYCPTNGVACDVYTPDNITALTWCPFGTGCDAVNRSPGWVEVKTADNVIDGVTSNAYTLSRLYFYKADGTSAELVDDIYYGQPVLTQCNIVNGNYSSACNNLTNRGTSFTTTDGSHIKFISNTPIVDVVDFNAHHGSTYVTGYLLFPNGLKYHVVNSVIQSVTDRNGNQISITPNSITDAQGHQVQFSTVTAADYVHATETITYTGSQGSSHTITITFVPLNEALASGFSLETPSQLFPALNGANRTLPFNPQVPSLVTLADSSQYLLRYNNYGELASIQLPTGGSYSFTWNGNRGTDSSGENESSLTISRGVTQILEYAKAGQAFTKQTKIGLGTPTSLTDGTVTTTVDDFDGSNNRQRSVKHYFYTVWASGYDPLGNNSWKDGLEYQTETYSGAGALLQTVKHSWQQKGALPWPDKANPYLGTADTQMSYDPRDVEIDTVNEANQVSKVTFAYDTYNNVTDKYEYDWGSGSAGGLLRHTGTSYLGSSGYISQNLVRLPSSINIYDVNGQWASSRALGYDESALNPSPATISVGHDSGYSTSYTTRGNVTTDKSWQALGQTFQGYPSHVYSYNIAGNVLSDTDPRGNTTTYTYTDGYYAGPNTITAGGLTTSVQYDAWTGKTSQTTDPNGVRTVYSYGDSLDRLTLVQKAAGLGVEARTGYAYPSPTEVDVRRDQNTTGDQVLLSMTLYDGLGRPTETRQYEGGSTYIASDTTYDALGRVLTSLNPSRPGDGLNFATTYSYDALGRTTRVQTADNAAATASYSGNQVTATDQAGSQRVSTTDGVGRRTKVVDYAGSGKVYTTQYSYDTLDNLTNVLQGTNESGAVRTRTFTYDSLKRLVTAMNPESGTITYTYDSNGNVLTKKDNRNVTISYGYDVLNRLTTKSYSDATPAVTYRYDPGISYGKGRLSWVSNSSSTTNYTGYDALGRVTAGNQKTGAPVYGFSYAYNLAGALTSETYPSGRVVTHSYDGANREAAVAGSKGGQSTNYVTQTVYWPHGAVYYYTLGNTVWHAVSYNSRLQPEESYDALNNDQTKMLLVSCPGWGVDANNYGAYDVCPHAALTNDNGNLQSWVVYAGGPASTSAMTKYAASYTYDGVNRVTGVTESGYAQTFGYDAFGNGWLVSNSGVPLAGNTPISNVFNANNQMSGSSYDAAGNQTVVNGDTLAYDAENRVKTATEPASLGGGVETYLYDGDGRRVEKSGPGGTTVYVYDTAGELTAEYSTTGATSPCTTCYLSYDHLGSARLVMDQNANVISRHDYVPFGEEVPANTAGRNGLWGPQSDTVNQKFTGKERDAETGLDYFGARYYGSALGRFTSPDEFEGGFNNLDGRSAFTPGPIGYADLSDPQTLNMYVYTRDNPLRFIDRDGHDFLDYLSGVANAFVSDNAFGAGRASGGNEDFQLGQTVGDGVAVITGSLQTLVGGGEAVVTSPAAVTGIGVAIPAAGAAVAAHGATTAAEGAVHLFKAGGNFSPKTKQEIKAAADGKCQNCGTETTPAQQSQKGVTPPANEGQTDHIQPKSKGGTNDPSNAQHLCRDCNIKKSDKLPNEQ